MTKKKHFENCGRTDGRTTDATPWHKLIRSFGPDELKTTTNDYKLVDSRTKEKARKFQRLFSLVRSIDNILFLIFQNHYKQQL